ncbi:hypothetical protein HN011_007462 [Eciton burchellii]|nr:hypothetical protein HN011_007462 [Eciton burchellii]
MFVQIRRLSLIKYVPNYGKQKKFRGQTVTYEELVTRENAAAEKARRDEGIEDTQELYAPIQDLSRKGIQETKIQILCNKIRNLETVEEKIFKINMPRYYGWKTTILNELEIPYNSLTYAQHITRTHVVKEFGLPDYYNNVISNEQLDDIVQEIKSNVENNILFVYCRRRQNIRDRKININGIELNENDENLENKTKFYISSDNLIQGIHRTMLMHLSSKYPHLLHAEVDWKPRLEASWFIGGVEPSSCAKQMRRKSKFFHDPIDKPMTVPIQYNGKPMMHLRYKHPLREIIPLSECENPAFDVPVFKFSPQVLGYRFGRQHLSNIPGFWPGDKSEFGFLSYHKCMYLKDRSKEYNDISDVLPVQAILASYSWLLTQACYQGFSTFNELTYPLTTQTVITDGKWWSFFVYQLNTVLLHNDHIEDNPKRNICWITKPMKLFDKIENEKVHGLNEELLKTLIKFYVNAPEERSGINLKPYLGESVKVIADIEHDEKRNWLETHYKHLMCNRKRHKRIPEIYDWQKIYMIRFKTRPMEKRREPWQFDIDVMKRRLDDHKPRYIPKCLRENPKKKRIGRWEKTYYPD